MIAIAIFIIIIAIFICTCLVILNEYKEEIWETIEFEEDEKNNN